MLPNHISVDSGPATAYPALRTMHDPISFGLGFLLFSGGWFLFILGLLHIYDRRLIENTPTSKCRAVAMGPVELSGRARGPKPMASLIAQLPCFISQVRVEQFRERGNQRRWVQVHKQQFKTPFYVEDDTGKVLVDPHGAVLELLPDLTYARGADASEWSDRALARSFEQGDPVFLGEALARYCNLRRIVLDAPTRFVETNLCDGDPVYVLGTATEQDQPGADRIIIRSSILFPMFIAEPGEQELDRTLGRRARHRLALGVLANVMGASFLVHAFNRAAPPLSLANAPSLADLLRVWLPGSEGLFMSIPLLLLIGLGAYSAIIYNGFIMLRNQVDQTWANIDVLLKQRFDLIPNLVETCKAYMEHERGVLQTVVEARARWGRAQDSAQKLEVARQSGAALREVFAVAERYPLLRANQTFTQFQTILTDVEARIADRRELYNAAVALFNNRIARLPDVWIATLLRCKPRPFFVAEAGSSPSRDVHFSGAAGAASTQ